MHLGAQGAGFFQGLLHAVVGAAVDQRADQGTGRTRVTHLHVAVDLGELGHQRVVNAVVHEQAAQRGAALAGRAHGGKGNTAQGKAEVGRGRDDGGVVATQLQDGAGKARGQARADGAAHGRGAGGREHGHAGIIYQNLTDGTLADEQFEQAFGRIAEAGQGALGDGVGGQGREGRLFGRLPHHGVAADQGQGRVPRPHGHGEVEGRDHAAHTERVPGFHHAVARTLGGNGQAIELARQAHGEVADVDHLLHLAQAFGRDLAGLQRHQQAQVILGGAQFFAQQAHQLATARGRNRAPGLEGGLRTGDGGRGLGRRRLGHGANDFAGDGRAHAQGAAGVCGARYAQALQQRLDIGHQRGRGGGSSDREVGHGSGSILGKAMTANIPQSGIRR